MGLLSWDDLSSSPELGNTVETIQASALRQNRAIPSAAPEIRQAVRQEGNRLSRLREMSGSVDLANRRLDLQKQQLNMENTELKRYAKQLPWANAIGFGNVLVGGLGAFANYRAGQRSEGRFGQLQQFQKEAKGATAAGLQSLAEQQRQQAEYYRQFLSRQGTP